MSKRGEARRAAYHAAVESARSADPRADTKSVSVYDLCEALKSWFTPVVNQAMGRPDDAYIGNAYWMDAAATTWLQLPHGNLRLCEWGTVSGES